MSVKFPDMGALEPVERAGRDELEQIQLARMKRSLSHAYRNVPHYRSKFDQAGLHPQDLRALSDLARFPFTTKEDLRQNFPYGMFAVPMNQVLRLHASSGTTGKPTVVGYTRADLEMWAGVAARSLRAIGVGAGDIVHNAHGYGLFTGGLGLHCGAERLGATVVPVSGGQTERQVQLIRDLRPTVLLATPSYVLVIADEMARQGIDPRGTSLRVATCGAEPWTESMRREIEARLGIDAMDNYGLSEVIGPGVAIECIEAKEGLTIWEDHFYPEVIDPVSGAVLPEGELGELVFTSLTKEALPIVRYRTRDLTHLLPGTARTMRRMARVTGRTDDMIILRGVNVFPTQIEELLLQQPELSAHYQLHLWREGHRDRMDVHVELRPEVGAALGTGRREAIAAEVAQRVKSHGGVSVGVCVLAPGAIERASMGKAKRVVDRRQQHSV